MFKPLFIPCQLANMAYNIVLKGEATTLVLPGTIYKNKEQTTRWLGTFRLMMKQSAFPGPLFIIPCPQANIAYKLVLEGETSDTTRMPRHPGRNLIDAPSRIWSWRQLQQAGDYFQASPLLSHPLQLRDADLVCHPTHIQSPESNQPRNVFESRLD